MKFYWIITVFLVMILLITGCKPVSECRDGICNAEAGETAENCPADCLVAESQETQLTVESASETYTAGEDIIFEVKVSNIAELYGFQFDLSYDSNVLEYQYSQEGTFLNKKGMERSFCIDPGVSPGLISKVICTRLGAGSADGSGVLHSFTFKALASGESDVTLSNVKLAKSSTDEIPAVINDKKVIIV